MLKKIGALLSSVRFWIIVLTGVIAVLNGADPAQTIELSLAAVVGVGSLDSFGKKIAGN